MDKIIIIGGEGTASNIAEALVDAINNYNYKAEFLGFANDNPEKKEMFGLNIFTKIKDIDKYYKYKDIKFIYALYRPDVMKERTDLLQSLKIPVESQVNFIHPKSYLAPSVKMGVGNVFLPNSSILNNVTVGMNNIINTNVVVEHETVIGNSNFLSAGCVLGANIKISNSCFIGLNSSLRENISVEENVFIGMNSLILNNCQKGEIWYGVPATKRIQHNH